jgi:tagatose 6-phosphate kinase
MEEAGAACYFTKIKGQTRTNVNLLAQDGSVTELLEPGPLISKKELEEFRKQFSGCLEMCRMAVLSGSIPEGVSADIYADLVRECRERGVQVILDSSGEALQNGICAGPDWVKPNRKELEQMAGRALPTQEDVRQAAVNMCREYRCRMVVSLGAEGLMYADGQQTLFREANKVKAVNTVGCGDTVVASLCMSCLEREETDIMLRKAAALAAANATTRENGRIPMQTYLELL